MPNDSSFPEFPDNQTEPSAELRTGKANPAGRFRWLAILSLGLIAAVSLIALLGFLLALQQGRSDSALINQSGRQRMLSQQLVKEAILLSGYLQSTANNVSASEEAARLSAHMAVLMERWTDSQRELENPSDHGRQANPRPIAEAFLGLDGDFAGLEAALTALLSLAGEVTPDASIADKAQITEIQAKILLHEEPYLQGINQITQLYEEHATNHLRLYRYLQWAIFALLLGTLALIHLLLFRPYARLLSDYYHETAKTMHLLADEAASDPLTGLYNKRSGLLLLSKMYQGAKRGSSQLTLVFLDLDGLKLVNDTLGHEAGDRMIKRFALALRSAVRAQDAVFRYGGDEFVMLLPADRQSVRPVLERLGKALEFAPADCRDEERCVAWSWGAASFTEFPDADAERLLAIADERMYAQKKAKKATREPG